MAIAGERFGRYELRGVLGQGGFATVYRAFDPGLGREVALKVLLPHLATDADLRRRFTGQAQALAGLQHANIVTIFDVGEAQGRPFFAMELVRGDTLADLLKSQAQFEPAYALQVVRSLASALDYMHAAGLVHRDVKPANVLIEPGGRVVLMDLGVARLLDGSRYTHTGMSLGTPAYMAPEQVRGEHVGPPADLYALGILTYQMLAGRPPFVGDSVYLMHAQAYDPPPPLDQLRPGLSPAIYGAIATALAKDAAQRQRTAAEFVAQLSGNAPVRPVAPPRPIVVPPGTVGGPPGWQGATVASATSQLVIRPDRRSPARTIGVVGAVAGVLVAVLIGIAFVAARSNPSNNTVTPTVAAATTNPVGTTASTSVSGPAPTTAPSASAAGVAPTSPATSTAPSPSTQAPSVPTSAPPPTAAAKLAVSTFDLLNGDAWGRGQATLQGCPTFQNAGGTSFRLRITPVNDPQQVVADTQPLPAPAASGSTCLALPPQGQVSPGNYVAILYDGDWKELQRDAFTVQAPAAPPDPIPTQAPPRPTATQIVLSDPAPPLAPRAAVPAAPDLSQPAANNSSLPALKITGVTPDGPAYASRTFVFRVTASNSSVGGVNASITVSSPDATVSAVGGDCGGGALKAATYAAGNTITYFDANGMKVGTKSIGYGVAELQPTSWPNGTQCTLVVSAAMPSSGSARFYLRASTAISSDRMNIANSWPHGGNATDQSGLAVISWSVPVNTP